ncbi:PLP-dependent aminotransferase family protein [Streptomyces sp. VRA16 Mangrove soil]|uniref:MocR-like transcription factor YczR n=1 Tax=Streptomyces sp. VRA16 Mangrove soil TaxID=2817434 RepID=UPI001A9FD995|nr:PLP-dependent aminotransferase family protein [Streptomyces sp. VRA16 Mangrove soil]MBO1331273.1 PLP-dependent aminotransferase family protein [Streptomyces sp. VRA16 Mangrove soil]
MAEGAVVRSMDSLGSKRLAELVTGTTAGRRPGYRALAQGVRTLLLDGRIPLHARLPAERGLATALGVSRATVTAAYDLLRESGYARSRRGAGTWTELPDGARPTSVATPAVGDDVLDLAIAAPGAVTEELTAAYAAAAPDVARHAVTPGYHPYGLPELRAAIAERYTRRGLPTLPEQILVTTGAQQAVALTLTLLGRPGDRIAVENPSYANALAVIRRLGLRTAPVPVTDEGWDAELFAATLRQSAPRLAYLIPDFQNPTGRLMPAGQRRRLIAAARATGTWLVVDETVADIGLDVPTPPPFASLAGPGGGEQIVTVGSLSKGHWSGLRVGWVRAGTKLITELTALRVTADMSGSVLDQLVAGRLIDREDEVLRHRLPVLRAQRDHLAKALAREFPEWRWELPPGGMSLWVDLGRPVASALSRAALRHGVRIEGGSRFGADPGTFEHRLRFPYTQPVEVLDEAVRRIAASADTWARGLGAAGDEPGRPHWVA